jgi:hypothetical protein
VFDGYDAGDQGLGASYADTVIEKREQPWHRRNGSHARWLAALSNAFRNFFTVRNLLPDVLKKPAFLRRSKQRLSVRAQEFKGENVMVNSSAVWPRLGLRK